MKETKSHLHIRLKGHKSSHTLTTRHTPKNNRVLTSFLSAIHKKPPPIEDPLWERVCREVIDLMGYAGQPIRQCKPVYISHRKGIIALDCRNKKAFHFAQQFDFIILSSLKPYFPALKVVKARGTRSF